MNKNIILGVGISNASSDKILEFLLKGLQKEGQKLFVVTPNPEMLVLASKNLKFRSILNSASLALPDGIGVIWAGKILSKNFAEKVTGVEMMKKLCQRAADYSLTVGLLGGGPKIAERTAECLLREYPKLKIVFTASEWRENKKIDILFVAFGAPKQEIWISDNLKNLPVKLVMGVGGAFDYLSGTVVRAPEWVRKAGFEWLFRLVVQPWRLKRQLALLQFIYLVLREKFH